MHVVQIGCFLDPLRRAPAELLAAWWSLVDIAEAPIGAGGRVSVVQASHAATTIQRNGVDYYFSPAAARPYETDAGHHLALLLQQLRPDVMHVHGLSFPRHVRALSRLMPAVPIFLQDHANGLPKLWHRPAWRRAHREVAGISFCAMVQAQPFQQLRLLGRQTTVFEIPESTSRFTPGDRAVARSITGVQGEPAILWIGHLNNNKDPLTVLRGFRQVLQRLPQASLWMCFASAPLGPEVKRLLASHPPLAARVHLLGKVEHQRVQDLMRSADLFVLGSHREGSGYSLIEALATGLAPVVTDIPSFRSLTGNGAVGALWPCGDAMALADSLVSAANAPMQQVRRAVRSHFLEHVSMAAVGRRLVSAYQQLIDQRRAAGQR
jgi:glycosyltransferase involved in cell wall biosynthesis